MSMQEIQAERDAQKAKWSTDKDDQWTPNEYAAQYAAINATAADVEAWQAAQAPASPDMVSVPREPTPEMIKAGTKQIRHAMDEGLGYTHSKFYTHEVASLVYKAMIEQGAAK